MAVAPTVELAIALRFAGGVFAAASIPTSFAYVADTTHGPARARAMGFLSAAMGLAFVFSPVIGGALGDLGTALPFLGAGACAFAGAVLVFVALPAAPAAPRRAQDGRSRRARLAGDLGPLLPILAISFLVSSTDGSRPVAVAVYAADRLAAAPSDLGLLFGTIGLSFTLGQLALAGPLIDRFGERTAIALGAFVTGVGFLLVPFTTGLLPLAGALAIQGVGMALGFAAIPAYISHTTASGQGVAMGWRSATQSAGQVVGPIIGGWLYELDHAWPAFVAAGLGLTAAVVGVLALRPLVTVAHEHPAAAPSVQEPVA
jgi:MFS family permease